MSLAVPRPAATRAVLGLLCPAMLAACAAASPPASDGGEPEREAFASTYAARPSEPLLIVGATLLTGDGARLDEAQIYIADGLIQGVGRELQVPAGVRQVDAHGKWITPGLIDVHSHLGNFPGPAALAHQDGNEMSGPNTAEAWAEHSVWPQDPAINTARAGGVTTFHVLPGSANLFGGRGVTLKNVPARTMQEMKFPGAPHSLKMACGENPKRLYGGQGKAPMTRMGSMAGYRQAWSEAQEYMDKQEKAAQGKGEPPPRNLKLDTLAGVLKGEIIVQNHCYRADEMANMIDLAREFGYHPGTFHHAVEAYKVADLLAKADMCAAMWADWWGFKLEAWDATRENVAMVDAAGACAIVHSDSALGIQRLNQETAKIMGAARRAGLDVSPEHAIRWVTSNSAKALGIAERTGTLAAGKIADVVVWSGDPFSVYTMAERVYVDGALVYDRHDPARQPKSDFELGMIATGGGR
jgi:imidazolonepropionase-like amidohydrolase